MRNRDFLLVVGTAATLLGAAACNNDKLTSINRNPNSPEDVPASTIFTNAARNATARWIGNGYDLRGTEWVVQHLAEVQYPDEDDYKRLQASSTTPFFDSPYTSELEDFRKIIQKGQAAKDPGTWAPAAILRVLDFSYLTNTFGDVPYFQALAGDSTGSSLTPQYDKQQDIYTDMFKQLDAAAKALAGVTKSSLNSADPIYGGDPLKWRKLANSLRLRLAMQIVNVDAATASTQIQAALSDSVISSNADNAQINWPGDGVYNNPWSDNFAGRDDHRMSQTFMNLLLGLNDPRITVFATPATQDTTLNPAFPNYAGMPNGLVQATAQPYFNDTSRPGLIFWPPANLAAVDGGTGTTTPTFIMTYAEVSFIKAEAANRGLGGVPAAQAQAFYNAGIAASFAQWGVSMPASYLTQSSVAYAGNNTNGLVQIDEQEWIALFTDGGTTWSLWRRTCIPNTVKPGPEAITTIVPRRFEYSTTEYSVNFAAVQAANARQGADLLTTPTWWDKNWNTAAVPTYTAGCGQQ
ncbi:MAG TPA: SusD/RagB family nutrient-binding outer membrane lipoprotein [Gemmatimonadaceae bacterium]|jgi:hypothetical protein